LIESSEFWTVDIQHFDNPPKVRGFIYFLAMSHAKMASKKGFQGFHEIFQGNQ